MARLLVNDSLSTSLHAPAETDCHYCNHFEYSNHTYSEELTHTVHEHHSQTLCEPLLWGSRGGQVVTIRCWVHN